jgi:collagenase-like PrtC family protease
MNNKKPKLVTFISNHTQLKFAITSGADHLILEDSKVAVRSYSDDFSILHFEKISILAQTAKQIDPDIILSVNCDLLMHERHIPILLNFISTLKKNNLDRIRIQDPGLIAFFKEHYPTASIELAYEIGNQNYKSMAFYQDHTLRQVISNDVSKDNIAIMKNKLNTELEVQVQGPILIQYSNRRFLTGLDDNKDTDNKTPIKRIAQDEQYLGRDFNFYDNQHGHFMFLYFDRCLLKMINDLGKLQLDSWLIDARGESEEYFKTCLSLYKKARDGFVKEGKWTASESDFKQLADVSVRPQRPGFFRVNKTDQIRRKKHIDINTQLIGTVLDSIKEEIVTLELETELKTGDKVILKNPKGLEKEITISKLKSLTGEELSNAISGQLVQTPWQKYLAPKVKLYKISN